MKTLVLRRIQAVAVWRVAIVSLLCALLLMACGTAEQGSATSSIGNSAPQVQRLTRIAQAEGVAVTSAPVEVRKGQIIYAPAYSHILHGDGREKYFLAATLSIRNTSLTDPIVIRSVRYYNSAGKLVKENMEGNLQLAPLATTEFFVPEQDASGGSGANFIVEWIASEQRATEPIVEVIMLSTRLQQGISFTTAGSVIQELGPEDGST